MKNGWRHACFCTTVFLASATVSVAQTKVPEQVRAVTDMLRKLDEPDLANTIESDIRSGRTTVGPTGDANATTGVGWMDRSVLLRPIAGATGLGTGTTDNRMTINDKILNDINTAPAAEKTAARTTNVVGWALTLRHEYVHMGQKAPNQTSRFENPAYRETIKTGVAWYRTTKAELDEVLAGPPTRENLERATEIRMRLNALGDQVNVIFNDMPALFESGSLAADTWMTLDGGRATTHSGARTRNWKTMGEDKVQLDEATARFRTAVNAVSAPQPGTGTARGGGSGDRSQTPPKAKKSIFDKINDALDKTNKALTDANAVLATKQGQNQSSASGGAGATVGAAAPGSTTLTLELPGYWGHLNYTISGAQLNPPTGSDRGNVGGRQYSGKFGGSTLTVSGNAVSDNESSGPGSGDYYEVVVEVNVGKEHGYYGYIAQKGEKLNKPFNIRVPISPDATSGTFSISLLEQNRNYGPHGWVVTGTLTRQ